MIEVMRHAGKRFEPSYCSEHWSDQSRLSESDTYLHRGDFRREGARDCGAAPKGILKNVRYRGTLFL